VIVQPGVTGWNTNPLNMVYDFYLRRMPVGWDRRQSHNGMDDMAAGTSWLWTKGAAASRTFWRGRR
jgi:hypothetical protein